MTGAGTGLVSRFTADASWRGLSLPLPLPLTLLKCLPSQRACASCAENPRHSLPGAAVGAGCCQSPSCHRCSARCAASGPDALPGDCARSCSAGQAAAARPSRGCCPWSLHISTCQCVDSSSFMKHRCADTHEAAQLVGQLHTLHVDAALGASSSVTACTDHA